MTNEEAIAYWEQFESEIADVFGKHYPKEGKEQERAVKLALSALREQAERKHAVDAVEVVFCKDCQYRETTNCITPDLVNDDDYCSYGKRRESEVSE